MYRSETSYAQMSKVYGPKQLLQMKEMLTCMFDSLVDMEPNKAFPALQYMLSHTPCPENVPGLNVNFYKLAFKQYKKLGFPCPDQLVSGCLESVILSPLQ